MLRRAINDQVMGDLFERPNRYRSHPAPNALAMPATHGAVDSASVLMVHHNRFPARDARGASPGGV